MGPDGYFVSPVQYLQAGQYKVEFQDSTDSRKFKSKVFKSTCEERPADPGHRHRERRDLRARVRHP